MLCALVAAPAAALAAAAKGAESEDGKGAPAPADAAAQRAAQDAALLAAVQKGGTWHVSALSSGSAGSAVVHYWSKGPKFRAETVVRGHRLVTVVAGDTYTVVDELTRRGTTVKRSALAIEQDARRLRPFANERQEILAAGGEKVRSEEIGGTPLDVYRVTDRNGRLTAWITQTEVPVTVRAEVFDRQSGHTTRIDYMGWQIGFEIPDAFFTAPTDFRVVEMSYEDFAASLPKNPSGPAPIFYGELLHGTRGLAPE